MGLPQVGGGIGPLKLVRLDTKFFPKKNTNYNLCKSRCNETQSVKLIDEEGQSS